MTTQENCNPASTPATESSTGLLENPEHDSWQTVVWDDNINLMSYVTYVFRKHFGFSSARAHALMLRVHTQGSAVVAEGSKREMALHVEALHGYGLQATLNKVDA